MSLEDEARLVVAQNDTKDTEAQNRKALEETPVVPEWSSELVSRLLTEFPDSPVYRWEITDEGRQRTIKYLPIGRGWGISCHWRDEGYKTGASAVLMRDGSLYKGNACQVPRVKIIGIPSGISHAVVAQGPLINAFNYALPEAAGFRRTFGICGVAAVMSGAVEAKHGGLTWWDTSRS